MKVLVSSCVMGNNVRWNGKNKKAKDLQEWADKNSIVLVPVCPEDELFGTPRAPIRLSHIDGNTVANMKGSDVMPVLDSKCVDIFERHPDAVGFIGIARSPSCGISVGVKNLGRTIKGSMHKTTSIPTVEYNQIRNDKGKQDFLRRVVKAHEHICSRQESGTSSKVPL